MSNHLAIATVTALFRHVLEEYLPLDEPSATVTSIRPDSGASGLPSPGVNLFLYNVSSNTAFRNEDLPARTPGGRMVNRPRAALNLHYLCSFYGDETVLEPQRVLGSFARIIEAQSILDLDRIQTILGDPLYAFLAGTDLNTQVEQVRISPENLTIDDMSKIWSTLLNTTYPLSLGYTASAVLIEAPGEIGKPLPVLARHINVSSITPMTITSLSNEDDPQAMVCFGDTLSIVGTGFTTAVSTVEIDSKAYTGFTIQSLNQIDMPLTNPALRAGACVLKLKTGHFQSSNSMAFLLGPLITIQSASVTSSELPIAIDPAVGREQKVRLLLNEYQVSAPSEPRQYVIDAPENNGITDSTIQETSTIVFDVAGTDAGEYLVRVEVDGAQSGLERTLVSGQLTITDPRVTIP